MAGTANTVEGIDNGRRLALVIGAAYVLVGLLGFAVTGFDAFASPGDDKLLGIFGLNPLHNVVHLIIGFAGLAMWKRRDTARAYGVALVAGYGATFVYGLMVAGESTSANFLSINAADNGLHLISAVAGALILALVPRGTTADASSGNVRTTV